MKDKDKAAMESEREREGQKERLRIVAGTTHKSRNRAIFKDNCGASCGSSIPLSREEEDEESEGQG